MRDKYRNIYMPHNATPKSSNASLAAQAWSHFSAAYRKFPMNICFEWYGPLHHCIAWPWHLFPVDEPLAPSWLINQFPAISGDRIGE